MGFRTWSYHITGLVSHQPMRSQTVHKPSTDTAGEKKISRRIWKCVSVHVPVSTLRVCMLCVWTYGNRCHYQKYQIQFESNLQSYFDKRCHNGLHSSLDFLTWDPAQTLQRATSQLCEPGSSWFLFPCQSPDETRCWLHARWERLCTTDKPTTTPQFPEEWMQLVRAGS